MKKVVTWVCIGLGTFAVLIVGIFLLLNFLEPMDDNMQIDVASSSNTISKNMLVLKQTEIDSLNNKINKLKSDLFFSNLTGDSLREQIGFNNRLIEQYKQNINKLNKDILAATKTKVSIQELAKTYETMKSDEMRPILKNVNDRTIIAIYKNMNSRKRKDIFKALPSERAAAITQRLAGAR